MGLGWGLGSPARPCSPWRGGAEAEPSWKLGACRLGSQGPASVLSLLPGLPAGSPGLWALGGAGWGGPRWLVLKNLLSP